jgi:hypothetical protein
MAAISGDQIVQDFMTAWFSSVNIKVWIKMLSREELEEVLKAEYENTVKRFENFLRSLQVQDLTKYLELKKAFQQTYEVNSKGILMLFDEAHKPVEESK